MPETGAAARHACALAHTYATPTPRHDERPKAKASKCKQNKQMQTKQANANKTSKCKQMVANA